ncbi:MAG: SMP-30/gluconolactonase/LRE family protein [Phycisphaeraceae bacterium]|nr:SMP-30/gluconolactonase/LRE family protein [Phycisphaeraceae bacterium]
MKRWIGYRVSGIGFRVSAVGPRLKPDTRCLTYDTRYPTPDTRPSAAFLLILLLTGCAGVPRDTGPHPAWPPPPAPPRIVHLRDISSADDIRRDNALSGLGRLIFGGHQQYLASPNSCATDGTLLCISDQDLQGVHLFDMDKGKGQFINKATEEVHFVSPVGVAICGDQLAVADSALRRVYLLARDGKPMAAINKSEGFQRPTGLAWDAARSELYVVDTLANEVCVFSLDGRLIRRFGSPGIEAGQFHYPTHIGLDGDGHIYVSDSMNFRVQVLDRHGQYHASIGELGDASGYMAIPKGVAIDPEGHVYVVDSYLTNVQVFDHDGQLLLYFGQGGAERGQFRTPTGLAVDQQSRLYVCDSQNHRVQVFQYIRGSEHEPQ